MNQEYIKKLKKLIDESQDNGIVQFGAPESDLISYEKPEKALGVRFPESYIWFLKNYGGGYILGDEIYSIYSSNYNSEVEMVPSGDIVYNHLVNLKNEAVAPHEIEITSTDFGERFFFNYNEQQRSECPIYLRIGSGEPEFYAANFYEFLYKRIKEASES